MADSVIPDFEATALTGETVESDALVGQWTLLIVTPSRDAAESTRRWAEALRGKVDTEQFRVRDVLAIDLPFFMTESDVLEKAREKIPSRYHDQTWILAKPVLENALGIPRGSERATVIVLDPDGTIVRRVHGAPDDERMAAVVEGLSKADQ